MEHYAFFYNTNNHGEGWFPPKITKVLKTPSKHHKNAEKGFNYLKHLIRYVLKQFFRKSPFFEIFPDGTRLRVRGQNIRKVEKMAKFSISSLCTIFTRNLVTKRVLECFEGKVKKNFAKSIFLGKYGKISVFGKSQKWACLLDGSAVQTKV